MKQEIVQLSLLQFGTVYLLLIVVLFIMKKSKIKQSKLLFWASIRMTIQLIIAGLLLTYIFKNPHPVFSAIYIFVMAGFAVYRVWNVCPRINIYFKLITATGLVVISITTVIFFVGGVVQVSIFNPQYVIPLGGMIIGNTMTGLALGIKTFTENLEGQKNKISTLQNLGVSPHAILMPFVNTALETALLPTLNAMLGMGIVSLPGMMTGQILSGTLPTTAIVYQIAIMITICTVVCLTVYVSLYFGHKTLYNAKNQIQI